MGITLEPGIIVAGRYRLDRVLGEGGMGVVWAATHAVTRRTVAMKFVRTTLQKKEELRQRLLREAHAAAAVRHPHVVEILDVFELEPDTPVIVMALLHGETLGQYLEREQRMTLEDAAGVLSPAISAIGTAHARGIIHRDLKPDNIYLAEEVQGKVVKVLDFGIAKLPDVYAAHGAMRTQTGSTLGTPAYMAPEQIEGANDVDHRADIWALGVIAYECLSGLRPIEGDNAGQVVMRLMKTGITPLAQVTRGLPRDVTSLVDRMLSREPGRRPQDLREAQRLFASFTDVSVPTFGGPRSEVATTFDRASQRSSEPDSLAPAARPESEPDLAERIGTDPTLPDAALAGRSTKLQRWNRLKTLSFAGATSLVGMVLWLFVNRAPHSGSVVVTTQAALQSDLSVASPAMTAGVTDVRTKEELPPERPARDAVPSSQENAPAQAASASAKRPQHAPVQKPPRAIEASVPLSTKDEPVPMATVSAGARVEVAAPHNRGLVDQVPF